MRWLHKLWANFAGYYWTQCPICGEYYGGHELKVNSESLKKYSCITGKAFNKAKCVCPRCNKEAKNMNDFNSKLAKKLALAFGEQAGRDRWQLKNVYCKIPASRMEG
jgi:hypothetical protein